MSMKQEISLKPEEIGVISLNQAFGLAESACPKTECFLVCKENFASGRKSLYYYLYPYISPISPIPILQAVNAYTTTYTLFHFPRFP